MPWYSLWCVWLYGKSQSFPHGHWAAYESISSSTHSKALLYEGYIRRFHSAMRAYKACLPRMQLPQQFLLHVLMLLFFFLRALGQNSVQKFVWEFRTDVSEPFPWALRCVYRLKFVSFPSFHRLIYRHVTTSVLSFPLRMWPLGTILVLLLTTWWPFRRAVDHLLHSLESTAAPFIGFHSIPSVKRDSWSFLWMKAYDHCGRYETDIADGGFIGKYWWYVELDTWSSSEWVFRFLLERYCLFDAYKSCWDHWLCRPYSFPRFQDIF